MIDPLQWCPHMPHPKQREFLSRPEREVMYGGAVAGGKSDALLMAALMYADAAGYSALLIRRTFTDLSLPGAIMDRAKSWLLPQKVAWSDALKRFTFSSGAMLTFAYIDSEADKYRYQSAEFDFIGFDELTQFPESWYRYMFSRLRRKAGSSVPSRMYSATNPGGIGHEWVRDRWSIPDDIDFSRTYAYGKRAFVPAKLEDNPSTDAEGYEASLAELDPVVRNQLRFGRWMRDAGGLVYPHFDRKHVIDEAPVCQHHILSIDYGFTDATAFAVNGWSDNDPNVYVKRCFKIRGLTPSAAAEQVEKLENEFHFEQMVGDIGGLGKGYAEEARQRFYLPIEPADKNNKRGYIDLFNGDVARGRVQLVRGQCDDLIDEWKKLPWDALRAKEVASFDNHCSDAELYGWRKCRAFLEKPNPKVPERGTQGYLDYVENIMRAEHIAKIEKEIADAQREQQEQESLYDYDT